MPSRAAALLALALALCACSRTVDTSARVDSRATATLEALHLEQHDAERVRDTVETVHSGPVITVETWAEPEAAPDGGTALVVHRRVTRAAPVEREVRAETRSAEHGSASTATQATSSTEVHAQSATHTETKPSLGFQIWLVLVPAGLIALGIAAWRLKGYFL